MNLNKFKFKKSNGNVKINKNILQIKGYLDKTKK